MTRQEIIDELNTMMKNENSCIRFRKPGGIPNQVIEIFLWDKYTFSSPRPNLLLINEIRIFMKERGFDGEVNFNNDNTIFWCTENNKYWWKD